MYCKVQLKHSPKLRSSESSRVKLQEDFRKVFGTLTDLDALEWKHMSGKCKHLIGIENQYIWGNQTGVFLYAFLNVAAALTEINIEYKGTDRTFLQCKRIIEDGIKAIRASQGRWHRCTIYYSDFYEDSVEIPLGINVDIEPWHAKSKFFSTGYVLTGQVVIAFITSLIALGSGYYNQKTPTTLYQYLTTWDSYQYAIFYSFAAMIFVVVLVLAYRFLNRQSNVMFQVKP
jgi:hypothetical protein